MKKKTIVFDFDGVIHIGYNGWKDGSIYGGIDTNLIDYIKILMKDYYIVISSNVCSTTWRYTGYIKRGGINEWKM